MNSKHPIEALYEKAGLETFPLTKENIEAHMKRELTPLEAFLLSNQNPNLRITCAVKGDPAPSPAEPSELDKHKEAISPAVKRAEMICAFSRMARQRAGLTPNA